jgi:cell division protein FtsL
MLYLVFGLLVLALVYAAAVTWLLTRTARHLPEELDLAYRRGRLDVERERLMVDEALQGV